MTDKELLYIKTIAEEGNISAAAKKLFMTQPALSHCLSSLEKEMGTPLFVRTPKGLNMTYAGECYYAMAIDILDIYNDYQQKLTDINQMRKGRIRLGMTRYISAMLLPQSLPEFSSKYPNVEVWVKEGISEVLELAVRAREIDFAIIHSLDEMKKNTGNSIRYDLLNRDDFCIILKKGTKYADKAARMSGYSYPVLDLKLLEDEPFIMETPEHRMRVAIDILLKRVNIEPRILLEVDLFETAQRLAEVGYGATIVNERYIRSFTNTEHCDVFSIPKKYKPYWFLCVVRPGNSYMPLASQTFLDIIYKKEDRKNT